MLLRLPEDRQQCPVIRLRLLRVGLSQGIGPAQRGKPQKALFPPAAGPPGGHLHRGREPDIMYFDQLGHLGDKPRFRMQPPQDLLCRCGASLLVPLKVPDPLLIGGAAAGLFHIVQQGGPAQRRLRRNILQHRQGVLPNIFPVVGVILHKAHHRQQLRQHHPNDINILPQHRGGSRTAQQPFQLGLHPLRRKIFQPWGVPAQGGSRSRLDLKPQDGGKPQPP